MKKALLLAAVVAMIAGSTTMAQDSVLWFDVRPDEAGLANDLGDNVISATRPWVNDGIYGGLAGAGQTLRITPRHADGFETWYPTAWPSHDENTDTSNGRLYLFMTVNDDVGDGDVISSVGLDFDLSRTETAWDANRIESINWTWDVPAEGNSGTADGSMVAGYPPSWVDARYAKVPVEAGPVYAVGAGMVPTNTYRLGWLDVQGADRVFPPAGLARPWEANSTFNLYMSVDSLLITRVFSTPGDADEQIAFGYKFDGSGLDVTASGSTVGNPGAGDPDAVIVVSPKGDNAGHSGTGLGDGRVNTQDTPFFTAAGTAGTAVQSRALFANDFFNPTVATQQRRINTQDIPGYTDALNNH